jgi:UDP-N-acetylglucosamine 2-epimerase
MRVVSVVGARSEFVKCAPVLRALAPEHQNLLVHTGGRYEYGTTAAFFEDLGIGEPDHDLGLSRGTDAAVVASILARLTPLIRDARPDWVLVYGSSHATLAGALVAAKLGIQVGHVEAGVRSYRRNTPDEMNHIVVDHVSSLHFCPTEHAVVALANEGLTEGVHNVGDVLLDVVLYNLARARAIDSSRMLVEAGIEPGEPFAYATVHHHENTSDAVRLAALVDAFSRLDLPVILPLHPLTQESLTEQPDLISRIGANVHVVDPLRPIESLALLLSADVVLTDSGGLQREAFYAGVPCVTLRDDTEWVDTVDLSANRVVGADAESIVRAVDSARRVEVPGVLDGGASAFGDGRAGRRIVEILG